MKKFLAVLGVLLFPAAVLAQSPVLTVLDNGEPPTSDTALAMMAGFVACDPDITLPRALAQHAVRFSPMGQRFAPGGVNTRARVVLVPNDTAQTERTADASGYLSAGGDYRVKPPVRWPEDIRVTRVAQAAWFVGENGPVDSVTLTFNVDVNQVIRELDRRFDGRVSANLGAAHARQRVWFMSPATSPNVLQCLRHPDM
ncbi:hypothetical protein [Burkholderia pseudomallei]|uniref:hypothetical protein n=1 Tax=Burkholderia pseudomallei TaxID=28450 RepID=UPI000A1A15F6|nr:hypothetical protein [Burkholderia pseudomallei]ARL04358.1 hypothetical protein BOC44_21580 [Burkholderia pseudomallei]